MKGEFYGAPNDLGFTLSILELDPYDSSKNLLSLEICTQQ